MFRRRFSILGLFIGYDSGDDSMNWVGNGVLRFFVKGLDTSFG